MKVTAKIFKNVYKKNSSNADNSTIQRNWNVLMSASRVLICQSIWSFVVEKKGTNIHDWKTRTEPDVRDFEINKSTFWNMENNKKKFFFHFVKLNVHDLYQRRYNKSIKRDFCDLFFSSLPKISLNKHWKYCFLNFGCKVRIGSFFLVSFRYGLLHCNHFFFLLVTFNIITLSHR